MSCRVRPIIKAHALCSGDRIGILLNRAERTIAYQKNGIDLGVAFENVNEEVLYPAVGLRTPDEEVRFTMMYASTSIKHIIACPGCKHAEQPTYGAALLQAASQRQQYTN